MPSTHQSRRLQSLAEPCVTAVTLGTCFYEARLCPVQWRPFHIHRLTSGCFFSFYFSIPGVLCGKEGTDKGSMSGVHLKTPHKTRNLHSFASRCLWFQHFLSKLLSPVAMLEHILQIKAGSPAVKLCPVESQPSSRCTSVHLLPSSEHLKLARELFGQNSDEERHKQV